MLFRELMANSIGSIRVSLHITDMAVSTKHIYFSVKKGAKLRIGYCSEGQECKVKQVKVILVD